MSHNLGTEIKKTLTRSEIATALTFCKDKSSVIPNCAGSVLMTNEPLQFGHLNAIPVW